MTGTKHLPRGKYLPLSSKHAPLIWDHIVAFLMYQPVTVFSRYTEETDHIYLFFVRTLHLFIFQKDNSLSLMDFRCVTAWD